MLRARFRNTSVHWIPEGIDPDQYKHVPYDQKYIDLLALGRRYDLYHEKIIDYFRGKETQYLYEKIKGEIIFPTRNEFIEGLAHTKISVCVPSNITHPERSGNIETMTIRYLQSMVSKCLVLGHAPAEMVELFGYNPVIEIDMQEPVNQIGSILNNFEEYIPLIEKNYQTVIQHHTWLHRWNQIKNIFEGRD
jgi:hypothetical protein